jgi:uncharacterized protein YbjT (DUF2867 family)
MKVLVTGGTGFVGPAVVRALLDAGHTVRVLEREPGKAAQAGLEGVEAVPGDMADAAGLRSAVDGQDAVVHLVAIITGKPEEFEQVMTRGTESLVSAAERAGVRRFVLMSALGTSEATRELTPYYRSKWAMEQAVQAAPFEHTIFRPSFVFGRDGGVLPTFLRLVRYSPVTPVVGPGTQRIQPIWVDDVAAYFAKSVDLVGAAGRTFEIGGPDVVTWDELYSRIATLLGKRRVKLHVPFGLMRVQAKVIDAIPGPSPITPDQVKMIEAGDNVATNDDARATFDVALVPLDEQLRRAA